MRITIFVIVSLALLVSARMRDKTGLEDISPEARAAILAAEEAAAREADDAKLLNALKDPEPRDVQDPKVVASVQWAVNHLKTMSDSGIYETLSLVAIESAAWQSGVFHYNTHVTVQLASPHLLDGVGTSTHRLMIMEDKADGTRSFAIDEFPIMEPDAIEEFWMRKVDAHRARRELEFRKLRWEARQAAAADAAAVAAGTKKDGECIDLCEERIRAATQYKWITDEEFLALEAAEAGGATEQAASVYADGSIAVDSSSLR